MPSREGSAVNAATTGVATRSPSNRPDSAAITANAGGFCGNDRQAAAGRPITTGRRGPIVGDTVHPAPRVRQSVGQSAGQSAVSRMPAPTPIADAGSARRALAMAEISVTRA